jgi:uncharacterized protein
MPAATLAPYLRTLAIVLPLAGLGAAVYIEQQNIPWRLAGGLLAALLVEAALFLGTGSEAVRERLAAVGESRAAALLTASAGLTWLLGGGGAPWQFSAAIAVPAVLAFWLVLLPESRAADVALLAVFGGLVLTKTSTHLYPALWEKSPAALVGELAWARTLIYAFLCIRKLPGIGYGFLPRAVDWREGVRWFLCFLPIGLLIGWTTGFAAFRELTDPGRLALAAVGTFAGHYLFVALREEFVFRGVLQQHLSAWLGSEGRGLLAASILFGLAHLPFREFPNWRFALVAAVAGWMYGRAYLATGSVRAAMVTHALVNVVARVLLRT